jgi:hypothetical protein
MSEKIALYRSSRTSKMSDKYQLSHTSDAHSDSIQLTNLLVQVGGINIQKVNNKYYNQSVTSLCGCISLSAKILIKYQ